MLKIFPPTMDWVNDLTIPPTNHQPRFSSHCSSLRAGDCWDSRRGVIHQTLPAHLLIQAANSAGPVISELEGEHVQLKRVETMAGSTANVPFKFRKMIGIWDMMRQYTCMGFVTVIGLNSPPTKILSPQESPVIPIESLSIVANKTPKYPLYLDTPSKKIG